MRVWLAVLAWWIGLCGLTAAGQSVEDVRLVIEPRPHYVGQPLRVEVQVTSANEAPAVREPAADGFELIRVGTFAEPLSVDAIGEQRRETSRFHFRYRLVPLRGGVVRVGPFQVGPEGRTAPFVLRPTPLPSPPENFSGAVGEIEASVEANPQVVRLGRTFEYRVRLQGPGALGTIRPIALDPGLDATVATLPAERSTEPPARTLRFRIEPKHSGTLRIAPRVLSWFDPEQGAYSTTIVPPMVVAVRPSDALDTSKLELGQEASARSSIGDVEQSSTAAQPAEPGAAISRVRVRLWAVTGLALMVGSRVLAERRILGSRRRSPSHALRALLKPDAAPLADPSGAAVEASLLSGLGLVTSDSAPSPSLVPGWDAIRDAVVQRTQDPHLADEVLELLGRIDAVRYGRGVRLPETWAEDVRGVAGRLIAGRREPAGVPVRPIAPESSPGPSCTEP
jgi:hypothetical protein